MIAIVYVDKILLEHQRDLKKQNSTGGLSERLLDYIDEYDEFLDERKEEEEDEEEGEKEEEREGVRENSTEGKLEAKRIFQNKNCDGDIIMDNYELKISNDNVIHNNKRSGEGRSKTLTQNNIEEDSEATCVTREEKDFKYTDITLNTAFSYYKKGKLLLYDAVDDIEVDEDSAIEGEKEVESGCVINLEENKDIKEVENEEKNDIQEINGKEQRQKEVGKEEEQQGRDKDKEQDKAQQQQQHQDEKKEKEKEKEKEKKEMIRSKLNKQLTNKLNKIENIIPKIEIEELHKEEFNSNTLTQNYSKNMKNGTNLKISCDKENLVRKEKIQRSAKMSDIFHFSRTFWILNLSCLFVYGKE